MNLDDLSHLLEQKAEQADTLDLRTVENQIHEILAQEVKTNFDGSHTPNGNPWARLKNPNPPGKQILVTTGALMRSALATAQQAKVSEKVIHWDFESLVPYGKYQQYGTRTIPPRPFLGVSDSTLERIVNLAREQLGKEWQ